MPLNKVQSAIVKLQINEAIFLSEASHDAKRINEIQPILNGNKHEQERLYREIEEYFDDLSAEFLRQRMGE